MEVSLGGVFSCCLHDAISLLSGGWDQASQWVVFEPSAGSLIPKTWLLHLLSAKLPRHFFRERHQGSAYSQGTSEKKHLCSLGSLQEPFYGNLKLRVSDFPIVVAFSLEKWLSLNKLKKPPVHHLLSRKQWTAHETEDLPGSQNELGAKPDL